MDALGGIGVGDVQEWVGGPCGVGLLPFEVGEGVGGRLVSGGQVWGDAGLSGEPGVDGPILQVV